MTEQPRQPDPRGASRVPADAGDEADLASQLDALLEQIEQDEPGAVPPEPEGAAQAQPVGVPTDTDDTDAADDETEAGQEDLVGDDLARQIQALLDEAKAEEDAPEAAEDAPVEAATAATVDEPMGDDAEGFDAPDPSPAADGVAVEAQQAQGAGMDGADATIEQLDQMLADEAEDALAGEFETVDAVLSTEMDAAPPEPRDAPAPAEPLESVAAAARDEGEDPFAGPEPALAAMTDEGEAEDEDENLHGAFESPQEVFDQGEAARGGAGARDVAAELDDQPEDKVARRDAEEEADAVASEAAGRAGRRFYFSPERVLGVERSVKRYCAMINRPLMRLSPERRNTIGWVGLLTLGNGALLILFALIF